jgi:hypothetical protein
MPGVFSAGKHFTTAEAAQMRERFDLTLALTPYTSHTRTSREDYVRLLVQANRAMALLDNDAGNNALAKCSADLLKRTEGKVGATIRELRHAANRAIRNGDEKFTVDNLMGRAKQAA